jgi:hypothetical protein
MPRTHVVGCYVIRQHVHCASKHKRSKQGTTSTAGVSTLGGGVLHIDALPHNKNGGGGHVDILPHNKSDNDYQKLTARDH